jgi:cyanate permease
MAASPVPVPHSPPTLPHVASRVAAALLGGYAFCWGFAALGLSAQVAAGRDFDQAWMLVMMLVFLVFLAAFVWAFAARSLTLVWAVLLGGGGAMTLAASLLAARVAGGA